MNKSESATQHYDDQDATQIEYSDKEAFEEGYAQQMRAIPKGASIGDQGLPYLASHPRGYLLPRIGSGARNAHETQPDHSVPLPTLDENE